MTLYISLNTNHKLNSGSVSIVNKCESNEESLNINDYDYKRSFEIASSLANVMECSVHHNDGEEIQVLHGLSCSFV